MNSESQKLQRDKPGTSERRHESRDRRVSPLSQRLRKGLWLEFHRKTEAGKFDVLSFSQKTRDDLTGSMVIETGRYEFSDRPSGSVLEPDAVVDSVLNAKWAEWSQRNDMPAVFLIESVAEYLLSKYNVARTDRRDRKETKRATA